MFYLAILAEMEEDKLELVNLGLSTDEVDGYIDFFIENYFREGDINDHSHLRMSRMQKNSRSLVKGFRDN